ncbi:MAG TPA: response regulator [Terriglobia bacterium]|nr:response regulator [Terriglobia bacterium]
MIEPSTVLIYHPNKILLYRLVQFVHAAGYATLSASDDSEALQLLHEMKPDVFLVTPLVRADLHVAEKARAKYPSVRLIVLGETDDMIEHAQALGIDEVVLYDETDIGNVLEALADSGAAASQSVATGEDVAVLIVDDEPDSVDMLAEFLKRCGYRTFDAATGAEALQTLKATADIRVVLLDIKLPDVGGVQILREIEDLSHPPAVIMLSAIRDSVIAKQTLRIGACDYLVKPVDLKALEEAISVCLTRLEYRGQHWWKREA